MFKVKVTYASGAVVMVDCPGEEEARERVVRWTLVQAANAARGSGAQITDIAAWEVPA
jgi:hypothetical protein